jgi:serine/threonine protein phosphatase PrpC
MTHPGRRPNPPALIAIGMDMTVAIRYAAGSDMGRVRGNNEDSAYAGPYLLAVADGMGGHAGGEVASSVVIDTIIPTDAEVAPDHLVETLREAVGQANGAVAARVKEDPALAGMGTTLTAMLWSGTAMALANIGDSRAYLLRDGNLFLITEDHTLEQMLAGEAAGPVRHGTRLVRVLDGRPERAPDVWLRETQPGDRYLLCSDGLTGPVGPEAIHGVLSDVEDLEAAVTQLIKLANDAGGPDNVTVIVADVAGQEVESVPPMVLGAASG